MVGHDHSDHNIVYGWTGPDLTIWSIMPIVEGDGGLGPRVPGRSRRDTGIQEGPAARDLADASDKN